MAEQKGEKEVLAILLDHEAEPCGQYRPDFRSEWWLCPSCGWESERTAHRDPGGKAIHQAQALIGAGLSLPPAPREDDRG